MEEAYHLSPSFTSPLIYAAFARVNVGDVAGADSLSRILEADRRNLPPYDRLRIDFLRATLAGDNAAGYRAVRAAAEILPGGSAHHAAADIALRLNRPREALEILATFDIERPWARTWVPYWNVVTSAYHLLGDHHRELAQARTAHQRLPERLPTLAYLVRALAALGRGEEILALLTQSIALRSPDATTPGDVMLTAATELESHGHPQDAVACLDRALAWHASLPEGQLRSPPLRFFHARTLYLLGRLDEARAEFEALTAEFPDEPAFLGHLGVIDARRGSASLARERQTQLAELERPYLLGRATLWRARIAARSGETDLAVRLLWQAVGEGLGFGPSLVADPDLAPLRDFAPFQEFIAPKG
jgi:tetratricopeptide (TPR) repeat protein